MKARVFGALLLRDVIVARREIVMPQGELIRANVPPVMTPVHSVPTKVSSVGAQFATLAQRKRRSQHCKHHQTYDSSSHITSPVSPAFWPLGRLNTGLRRKFWRPPNSRKNNPHLRWKWGRKRQILEPSHWSA